MIHLTYSNLLVTHPAKFGIIKDVVIYEKHQVQNLTSDSCIEQVLEGLNAYCDYQFYDKPIVELVDSNSVYLTNFQVKFFHGNSTSLLNVTFLINSK